MFKTKQIQEIRIRECGRKSVNVTKCVMHKT